MKHNRASETSDPSIILNKHYQAGSESWINVRQLRISAAC